MMRNRNSRLSFAALIALALTAGACSCDGDKNTALAPKITVPGLVPVDGTETEFLIDFGPYATNSESPATREVELRNIGSAAMRIDPIALTAPFSSDVPAAGLSVLPGASQKVKFLFHPTAEGPAEAEAKVAYQKGTVTFRLKGQGIEPAFACVPATLDFGNVEKGRVKKDSVVCTNNTDLDTVVQVPDDIQGTDKNYFKFDPVVIPAEGVSVPAHKSITIPVAFRAELEGQRTARFVLTTGSEESQLTTVNLQANSIASAIAVDPACSPGLTFGYVPVGAATEKTLKVKNLGSEPLTVTGLEVFSETGTDAFSLKTAAPFTIPVDDPTTPEAENEAPVVVEFRPVQAESLGAKQARIRITNTSNESTFENACLFGNAGGPQITCTPSSIDFGPVATGMAVTRQYICTNTGDNDPTEDLLDNLLVESIAPNHPEFTATIRNQDNSTGPKPTGYVAGEFFTVDVTYSPIDTGLDQTMVQITSNDLITPVKETAVTGDGRDLPPCQYTISPATKSLRFGVVRPGQDATLEFGIQNLQDTECLITNVRIEDDAGNVFSTDSVPYYTLPPYTGDAGTGNLRIPVTFSPPDRIGTPTIFTGKVRFEISNPASPNEEISLRGASQDPCAIIAPDHLDFGTVGPGCSTVEREFSILNICEDPITVTGIEINAGASDEFGLREQPTYPTTLDQGEEARFTMVYVAEDLGEDLGSVFVFIDSDGVADNEEPYMATLQGRGAADAKQTDRFEQEDRPKVDLLWIIDNSGSMIPFQNQVSTNLSSFLTFALAQQIDFQLGVTTTGVTPGGSCPGGANGEEDGRLFPADGATTGHPRILTKNTPNLAEAWGYNVHVGDCHFDEQPLEAAKLALSPGLVDVDDYAPSALPMDGNKGFLRKEANLSIVILTDEWDQSPDTPAFYTAFFKSIKGFRNENMLSIHAITGDRGTGCSGAGVSAQNGDRILDVVDATNGLFQPLCTDDWEDTMKRLSSSAFGFKTRFPLTNQPADTNIDNEITDTAGEIEVYWNGTRIPSVNARGSKVWEYNWDANSVDFMPLHVPAPGTQIEVTYTVACLLPDTTP